MPNSIPADPPIAVRIQSAASGILHARTRAIHLSNPTITNVTALMPARYPMRTVNQLSSVIRGQHTTGSRSGQSLGLLLPAARTVEFRFRIGYTHAMQIAFWAIVLVVCLAVLVKAADYFTEYSEKLGLALGLSSFIIGATIIAVGTSLPELVSSTIAVVGSGVTEFVADNIIGSNIANALLILGIGALYARTLTVKTSLIDVDLPFFFMSMALFAFFSIDRHITTPEGMFLLGFFIIFLIYSAKPNTSKAEKEENKEEMEEREEQLVEDLADVRHGKKAAKKRPKKEQVPWFRYIVIIVVSAAAVAFSAKYLIDSVLTLSELLGISSSILTITVVAIGTSLPEVLTSIAAIRRGNHAIAIGNVFGSNTFNLLLVGGFPALFTHLNINDMTFTIGVPFLILATFVVFFVTMDDKIRMWEGAAMLFLFMVFLVKIVGVI